MAAGKVWLLFFAIGLLPIEGNAKDESPEAIIAGFVGKYWAGQLSAEDLGFKLGAIDDLDVEILRNVSFKKKKVAIVLTKGAIVRFRGIEIMTVDTKSAGCKVGDYEAAAGTTITFSEDQSNLLTSIVTARPIKARGREWPANSKLLFYFKDGGDIFVYAVVLGEDLKGTPYKKGDKVYIGSIMDEDDKMSDELSLSGEDPTC